MNYFNGRLEYNTLTERFELSDYGGLHCGQQLEVLVHGQWEPTRIEFNNDGNWYLVGISDTVELWGLPARIPDRSYRVYEY